MIANKVIQMWQNHINMKSLPQYRLKICLFLEVGWMQWP